MLRSCRGQPRSHIVSIVEQGYQQLRHELQDIIEVRQVIHDVQSLLGIEERQHQEGRRLHCLIRIEVAQQEQEERQ